MHFLHRSQKITSKSIHNFDKSKTEFVLQKQDEYDYTPNFESQIVLNPGSPNAIFATNDLTAIYY